MKLVMCFACGDIFNLTMQDKTCGCGAVTGKYLNNRDAEVTGRHTAIAMGTGSLHNAMLAVHSETSDWREDVRHEKVMNLYYQMKQILPTTVLTWLRAESGPTNPNSG